MLRDIERFGKLSMVMERYRESSRVLKDIERCGRISKNMERYRRIYGGMLRDAVGLGKMRDPCVAPRSAARRSEPQKDINKYEELLRRSCAAPRRAAPRATLRAACLAAFRRRKDAEMLRNTNKKISQNINSFLTHIGMARYSN